MGYGVVEGMSNTTLSQVIQELERAWHEIQNNHPDLPDTIITSSRRRHRSEKNTRAQHCAEVWSAGSEKRLAEVTIFGERFMDGAEQVMQSLLHEAAHALAHTRGIKDTSNKNRFHNRRFVALAEELGLEGPAESGGTALGYSNCVITEATAQKYELQIKNIENVLNMYVPPAPEEEKEPKKPTAKAQCECPSERDDEEFNTITWAKWMQKKLEATGIPPLICGVCRQAFNPIDVEEA